MSARVPTVGELLRTRYAIGVDLGGTHIKAASVSETGEVLGRASDTTRDGGSAGTWVPTVRALVAHLEEERGARPAVEWRPLGRRVRVLPAALGDLAGAIGAARAALGGEFA